MHVFDSNLSYWSGHFSLFRFWIPLQARKQYLAIQCWTWEQLHFLGEQYLCMFSHTLRSRMGLRGLFSFLFQSWGLISHPVGVCSRWPVGLSLLLEMLPALATFQSPSMIPSSCVLECKCSSGFVFLPWSLPSLWVLSLGKPHAHPCLWCLSFTSLILIIALTLISQDPSFTFQEPASSSTVHVGLCNKVQRPKRNLIFFLFSDPESQAVIFFWLNSQSRKWPLCSPSHRSWKLFLLPL